MATTPTMRKISEQMTRLGITLTPMQRDELSRTPEALQFEKFISFLTPEMFERIKNENKKDVSTTIDDLKKQYKDVATAVESSIDGLTDVIQKRVDVFNKEKEKLNASLSGLLKGSEEEITFSSQRIATSIKEGNFQDILNVIDDMTAEAEGRLEKIKARIKEINDRSDEIRSIKSKAKGRLSPELQAELKSLNEERAALNEEKGKLKDGQGQQEVERLKALRKQTEELARQNEEYKEQSDIIKDVEERQKALRDFAGETTSHLKGMMAALSPGSSGYSGTIFSSLASQMALVNQGVDGFGNKLKSLGGFLANSLTKSLLDAKFAISGFFDYLYNQSIGKAFEFSKMFAEANKQTGGFGNVTQNVVMSGGIGGMGNLATKTGMSGYGIGLQELNKTVAELQTNFKNFNNLSLATQQTLTVTAAKMENLGVSTSQSAKLIETFSSAFGKSAEGASRMMESMAKDAIALGINVNKYFQEFESVMNKISGFATSADQIFKKLSAISQATRLSTDEIAGMSEKFKTLEGAAETVSGLNAALGGTSLRATELIQLDPAEAFLRIKEELDASGKKFEDLNIGFKRYLANAAGFSDVNAAARGFSSTLSQIRANMDKAKASQEELEKAQKRSAAFQDQYKKLLENVTVLVTPIIQALTTVVGWITKLNDATGGWILPLVVKFAIFSFAIRRIGTGIMFLGSTIATTAKGAAASLTSTAAATTEVGAATDATGKTSTSWWERMTAAARKYTASVREASAATKAVGAPGAGGAGIPGGIPNGGRTFLGMGSMGWGVLLSMGLMAASSMTADKEPTQKSATMAAAAGVKNEQDGGDVFINSSTSSSSNKILIAGENALKLSKNDQVAASPDLKKTFNSTDNNEVNNKSTFSSSEIRAAVATLDSKKAAIEVKETNARNMLITNRMQQDIEKRYLTEKRRQQEFEEKILAKQNMSAKIENKLVVDGKEFALATGNHMVNFLNDHTEFNRSQAHKIAQAQSTGTA